MRLFEIKTHDLLYNKSLDQQEGTYPYILEALNKGYCVRSGVSPLQKNVTPHNNCFTDNVIKAFKKDLFTNFIRFSRKRITKVYVTLKLEGQKSSFLPF